MGYENCSVFFPGTSILFKVGGCKKNTWKASFEDVAFARNAWRGLPPAQELSQL